MHRHLRFLPALLSVASISIPAVLKAQTDFGSIAVGSSSSATVTVTVAQASSFTAVNVVTWGAAGLDFTEVSGGTCAVNVSYSAGQTCTVSVSFRPKYAGERLGAVTLANPQTNTFSTTFLRGIGVGGQLAFAPGDATAVYPTLNGLPISTRAPGGRSLNGKLAVDGNGTLYLAAQVFNSKGHETSLGGILKLSPGSSAATLLPTHGDKGDTLTPTAVRIDGAGNLILTDGSDNALLLPPDASVGKEYQLAGLSSPAVDGAGNLFFNTLPASGNQSFVEFYDEDPNHSGTFSVAANSEEISSTSSLAVDSAENLNLFGEFGNYGSSKSVVSRAKVAASQLADLSTCCQATTTIGPTEPADAVFDSAGDILFTDYTGNYVSGYQPDFGFNPVSLDPVADGKGLSGPQGLAFDPTGDLYIFDFGNLRVVKVDRSQKSLSFAAAPVGYPGQDSPQLAILQNVGTSSLSLSSIVYPEDFVRDTLFTQTSNDCTASTVLAPGTACNLQLDFVPQTTGKLSESVFITDNTGATHSVSVSGTGISDTVALSATSLSFGNEAVGYSTASQNVTISNTGSAPLSISGMSFLQSPEPRFVTSNTCGVSLAVGASCRIGIRFTPNATGSATEILYISDSAVSRTQTVSISGTGIAPGLASVSLSSSSLSFSNETVGTSTATQNVTVSNTSSAVLYFRSIALKGANASSFITSNTCGASVAPGASCRIGVRFVPVGTGKATASILLTDNAATPTQTISLSGTGQ